MNEVKEEEEKGSRGWWVTWYLVFQQKYRKGFNMFPPEGLVLFCVFG